MLTSVEPGNTQWQEQEFRGQLDLAGLMIAEGKHDQAAALTSSAFRTISSLLSRPQPKPQWRFGLVELLDVAGAACLSRRKPTRRRFPWHSRQSIRRKPSGRSTGSPTPISWHEPILCLVMSNVPAAIWAGANIAWTKALSVLPSNVPERPNEMADRLAILQRIGRNAEAHPLAQKIAAMGYHETVFSLSIPKEPNQCLVRRQSCARVGCKLTASRDGDGIKFSAGSDIWDDPSQALRFDKNHHGLRKDDFHPDRIRHSTTRRAKDW